MSRTPSSSPFVALASLLLLAACSGDAVAPAGGEATLLIRADVSGTSVATVVVDISAPDLPTTVVFNVPVAAGVASGTLTIPAGSDRTIDRKSTRLNSSHSQISYAVFCLKKKKNNHV